MTVADDNFVPGSPHYGMSAYLKRTLPSIGCSREPGGDRNGHSDAALAASRLSCAWRGRVIGAAPHRQRRGHDRGGVVPTGLRQGRRCRFQEDGRRLREGERQQDRLQHHSIRGAAPEGSLGDHERGGSGCDGGLRSRVCPVERLGRQTRRCRRHCRDAENGFRLGRHRFLLSLQQRHETTWLLHGANEDQRDSVPYLAVAGREGGLQDLRYSEHLGCLSRFLQAGAGQVAGTGDAQHPCLRLSADRQRQRPDQHLQRVPDRLWRQGPSHPGWQAPHQ